MSKDKKKKKKKKKDKKEKGAHKKQKVVDDDGQVSFLDRVRELNRVVEEQPHEVDAWLLLASTVSEPLVLQSAKAEKRVATLERALLANKECVVLWLELLKEAELVWTPERLREVFEKVVAKFLPHEGVVWAFVAYLQRSPSWSLSFFRMARARQDLADLLWNLQHQRRAGEDSARKMLAGRVFCLLVQIEAQGGCVERAVCLMLGLLERHGFQTSSLDEFLAVSKWKSSCEADVRPCLLDLWDLKMVGVLVLSLCRVNVAPSLLLSLPQLAFVSSSPLADFCVQGMEEFARLVCSVLMRADPLLFGFLKMRMENFAVAPLPGEHALLQAEFLLQRRDMQGLEELMGQDLETFQLFAVCVAFAVVGGKQALGKLQRMFTLESLRPVYNKLLGMSSTSFKATLHVAILLGMFECSVDWKVGLGFFEDAIASIMGEGEEGDARECAELLNEAFFQVVANIVDEEVLPKKPYVLAAICHDATLKFPHNRSFWRWLQTLPKEGLDALSFSSSLPAQRFMKTYAPCTKTIQRCR